MSMLGISSVKKGPHSIQDKHKQYKLTEEFHNSSNGGHLDIGKTQYYVWKNMSKMTKNFLNNCAAGIVNKQVMHIKITHKRNNRLQILQNTSFEVRHSQWAINFQNNSVDFGQSNRINHNVYDASMAA